MEISVVFINALIRLLIIYLNIVRKNIATGQLDQTMGETKCMQVGFNQNPSSSNLNSSLANLGMKIKNFRISSHIVYNIICKIENLTQSFLKVI